MRLFRLSRDGAEKIIEVVAPRQAFAEALMFLSAPRYPVCAGSLSSAEVVSMDARDFTLMLRGSIATCFALLGAMSQRLHALIGEIDSIALHTAATRFARYLIQNLPDESRISELVGVFRTCQGRRMPVVDADEKLRGLLIRKDFTKAFHLEDLSYSAA